MFVKRKATKQVFPGNTTRRTLIALGSNLPGNWGAPASALKRAVAELRRLGASVVQVSGLYRTAPVGSRSQPHYLNAVVSAEIPVPPATLLRELKRMERRAGRRMGSHWGPRPLDLDILDHCGRICGWPARHRVTGRLVLPHPEAHRRAFVLAPLVEVAPHWAHPILGRPGRSLLARLGTQRRGVRRILDSGWISCEEIPPETGGSNSGRSCSPTDR